MDDTTPYLPQVPEHEPAGDIVLTSEAQYYLNKAGGWAKFLGIVGFVYTGLLVLGALGANTSYSKMSEAAPDNAVFKAMASFGLIIYLIGALVAFFLSLYLYQFGDRIKSGLNHANSGIVTGSLEKLHSFFKLYGILVIIALAVLILVIIGVVVGIGLMANIKH